MKISVNETVEKEVSAIRCNIAVRYEEDDMPNDYPHRKGDMWNVTIDLESGQIRDWPKGIPPRRLYMKVCDEGSYYLLGPDDKILKSIKEDYVPNCIPGEYGDYIDFHIGEDGKITNWDVSAENIRQSFYGDEE